MNYQQCLQLLYQSKAMEAIPDRWKMELPILILASERRLGFLFTSTDGERESLRTLITVSLENGALEEYSPERICAAFHMEKQSFQPVVIADYDAFFAAKAQYQQRLAEWIDTGKSLSSSDGEEDREEIIRLCRKTVSEELFSEAFCIIGKGFYDASVK